MNSDHHSNHYDNQPSTQPAPQASMQDPNNSSTHTFSTQVPYDDTDREMHKRSRGETYNSVSNAPNAATIHTTPLKHIPPMSARSRDPNIPNASRGWVNANLEQSATLDISRTFDDFNADDNDDERSANNDIQLPFLGSQDDYNDGESDYPQARLKRFQPRNDGIGENEPGQQMVQLNSGPSTDAIHEDDDGAFDREFLDLLKDFAQLELPQYFSTEEKCPLCSIDFPIEKFAEHVYQCITCLDDVEKQQLEDLDAQLARTLAMEEIEDFDFLSHMQKKTGFDQDEAALAALLEMDDATGTGDSSETALERKNRMDRLLANQALIFNQYKYRGAVDSAPALHTETSLEAECCVCGLMVPKTEIDQHVLGCLHTPATFRLGTGRKQPPQPQSTAMGSDDMGNNNTPASPAPGGAMGDDSQIAASTSTATTTQQQLTSTSTRRPVHQFRDVTEDGDDDDQLNTTDPALDPFKTNEAEDEERDLARRDELLKLQKLQQENNLSSLTQSDLLRLPTEHREAILPLTNNQDGAPSSNDGLNAQQIGLLARMIHDTTTSYSANASISSLLTTFQALGLNKTSLRRAKDELTRSVRPVPQSTSTPITPATPPASHNMGLAPLSLTRTRSQDAAATLVATLDLFPPSEAHTDPFSTSSQDGGATNNCSEMDENGDAKSQSQIIASSEFSSHPHHHNH